MCNRTLWLAPALGAALTPVGISRSAGTEGHDRRGAGGDPGTGPSFPGKVRTSRPPGAGSDVYL
jgi:hypothetical protein